jgi:hypothetical protein
MEGNAAEGSAFPYTVCSTACEVVRAKQRMRLEGPVEDVAEGRF